MVAREAVKTLFEDQAYLVFPWPRFVTPLNPPQRNASWSVSIEPLGNHPSTIAHQTPRVGPLRGDTGRRDRIQQRIDYSRSMDDNTHGDAEGVRGKATLQIGIEVPRRYRATPREPSPPIPGPSRPHGPLYLRVSPESSASSPRTRRRIHTPGMQPCPLGRAGETQPPPEARMRTGDTTLGRLRVPQVQRVASPVLVDNHPYRATRESQAAATARRPNAHAAERSCDCHALDGCHAPGTPRKL